MNTPDIVLITGATGAIGSALAKSYAAPGKTLILQGRRANELAELAQACNVGGAKVYVRQIDLREIDQVNIWLAEIIATMLPDLVIANAGVNTNIGRRGEGEVWEEVNNLLDINVKSTLALVNTLAPAMRKRGTGQIALISSLAGYFGLPITPSYCASKAALKSYGEALRGWLAADGVGVSVVMPGYVESKMCRAMPGPKPFVWPPERAATEIRKGLARNRARISFPFPLSWGCWLLAVMPPSISLKILSLLRYGG